MSGLRETCCDWTQEFHDLERKECKTADLDTWFLFVEATFFVEEIFRDNQGLTQRLFTTHTFTLQFLASFSKRYIYRDPFQTHSNRFVHKYETGLMSQQWFFWSLTGFFCNTLCTGKRNDFLLFVCQENCGIGWKFSPTVKVRAFSMVPRFHDNQCLTLDRDSDMQWNHCRVWRFKNITDTNRFSPFFVLRVKKIMWKHLDLKA